MTLAIIVIVVLFLVISGFLANRDSTHLGP